MTQCKDVESDLELTHVVVDVVDVLCDELRVVAVILVYVLNVHRQQVLGERLALGDIHRLRGRRGGRLLHRLQFILLQNTLVL